MTPATTINDRTMMPLFRTATVCVFVVVAAIRMESRFNSLEFSVADVDKRLARVEGAVLDNVRWSDLTQFAERLQDKNPDLKVPVPRK